MRTAKKEKNGQKYNLKDTWDVAKKNLYGVFFLRPWTLLIYANRWTRYATRIAKYICTNTNAMQCERCGLHRLCICILHSIQIIGITQCTRFTQCWMWTMSIVQGIQMIPTSVTARVALLLVHARAIATPAVNRWAQELWRKTIANVFFFVSSLSVPSTKVSLLFFIFFAHGKCKSRKWLKRKRNKILNWKDLNTWKRWWVVSVYECTVHCTLYSVRVSHNLYLLFAISYTWSKEIYSFISLNFLFIILSTSSIQHSPTEWL